MKLLIAVLTCHAAQYRDRAQAQRDTWAKHAAACGFELKFFLGKPPLADIKPKSDEVFLDVDDGYKSLPAKVQAMAAWAVAQGYDYVFKTDDDCYVNMMQLRATGFEGHDYVGRFRGPSGGYPADYASGYGYWLSALAMRLIAKAPLTDDWAEDRWVANTLTKAGIRGFGDDKSFVACYPPTLPHLVFSGPLRHAAVWCEYPPKLMREMYVYHCKQRLVPDKPPKPVAVNFSHERPIVQPPKPTITFKAPPRSLSKVCVLVKTFLRDGYLFDCVRGLEHNFPDVKIVIMDDGRPTRLKDEMYARLRKGGHVCEYLPYDSGFGEKSNAAIVHYDREYVLIASDDFDFVEATVRPGVERLVTVMDCLPYLSVASGRVDNNPYESLLERKGDTVKEIPLQMGSWTSAQGINFKYCDLTVNYSLIRRSVLGTGPKQVQWDGGDVKIGGGEHGSFFLDLKEQGHKVVFVPGVNITTMRHDPKKQDPIYDTMRGRARQPGRICLRKRGIRQWIMTDDTVEIV